MSEVNAPKRSKKASKKGKKSWRKNTDLDDVNEFLDDKRLEERMGGAFKDRKDEELFVEDVTKPDESIEVEEVEENPRLRKRKEREAKKLKCFQHLEITGGAPDPCPKRNRVRTKEERMNPTVKKKEEERIAKGIKKAKEITAEKHRAAIKAAKDATVLERSTRRRTKFDFDLWGSDKPSSANLGDTPELQSEWVDRETRKHVLRGEGKWVRRAPNDLRAKTSTLPSVQVPHGGASYNPSYSDHQDLLFKAAVVEMNKEKAQHKIDYHTTMMFPKKEDMPTEESYIKEMSEGIVNDKNEAKSDEEEIDEANSNDENENNKSGSFKLKTRKQRRKAKLQDRDAKLRKAMKNEKLMHSEILRLKSVKKEIAQEEARVKENIEKRKVQKIAKQAEPKVLSGHQFEDPEMELKLSEELTGNLRSIKPEGNLLHDRFKSLQKRNVIETRVKTKIVKNPKRRKRLEKRSYKMPWEMDKYGNRINKKGVIGRKRNH